MKYTDNLFKIEHIINGELQTNTYFVISLISNNTIIIDPADYKEVNRFLNDNNLNPAMIINTHGHYDHISANNELKTNYNIPIYIGSEDIACLKDPFLNLSKLLGDEYIVKDYDEIIYDSMQINFENINIKFYTIPGHTLGSILVNINNFFFTGDLVFTNGVGRIDLPTSDVDKMIDSLKKLVKLTENKNAIIFPGHGEYGSIDLFRKSIEQFEYYY